MIALIGEEVEVYQAKIDGRFNEHCSETIVALFISVEKAKEYIKKATLKHPKKQTFDSIKPFKSSSLLANYSSARIEEYYEESYEIDPEI